MRDLVLFAVVFGCLPFVLRKPSLGVLLWVWLSLMNPHRETWGPAYSFPFAYVVAIATLIGIVLTRDPRQLKGGAATVFLFLFVCWMLFSTAFALEPAAARIQLERVMKVQVFTFIALLTLYRREHAIWLVVIVALSIGYYGVKGGMFTALTLGQYRVWGPEGSFFFDNNAVGLAIVMTIPLFVFCRSVAPWPWVRRLLLVAIVLSLFAVVGSQSRGALVALLAMSGFLWLKGNRKVVMLVAMTALGIALVAFMPQSWEDRMQSILAYKEDRSAMSRISTWKMLFDLALDRPIVGGGFEPYSLATLAKYSPDSAKVHSAHSIYFQVLGEHGFVGFALFCVFWLLTWRLAARIIRRCKGIEDLKWAESLAKMAQVSLVGYFAGGLFLNLAYWDAPYYLFVALAVAWHAMLPPPGTAGGRLSTSPPRQLPAGNQLGVARNAPASRSGSRPGGRNSMTG